MSHPRKTTRDRHPVYGMIDPRCLYSVAGVMAASGIGINRLDEGRNAGILHPTNDGVRDWYLGEELIALIQWKGKAVPKRKKVRAA